MKSGIIKRGALVISLLLFLLVVSGVGFSKTITGVTVCNVSYSCGVSDGKCPEDYSVGDTCNPSDADCDKTPPVTTIIPNGKGWTNSNIGFTLSCSDAGSGCKMTQYKIINNTQSCTATGLTAGTSGTVSCASGSICTKKVCYRSTDNVGNVETINTSGIFYIDKKVPTASIKINNGVAYTNSQTVTLTLTSSDAGSGVKDCKYKNEVGSWTSWQTCTPTKSWTLTAGDGPKTVYYEVRDKALNVKQVSDTIILDRTKPTASIKINNGAIYTKSTSVTLTLTSSDAGSGVKNCRYKNKVGSWTSWQTCTPTKSWTLTAGDGPKTVYYEVRDKALNVKQVSDTIILDTTPPTISDDYIDDDTWVMYNPTITLSPIDTGGSGVKEVKYCEGSGCNPATTRNSPYKLTYSTLANTALNKIVRYRVWDNAGNPSSIGQFNVKIDKVKPTFKNYSVTGCDYKTGKTCWVKAGTTTYHTIEHYDEHATPYTQYITFTNNCNPNNCNCNWNTTCASGKEIKSQVFVDNNRYNKIMYNNTYLDITGATCIGSCTGTTAKEKWTVKAGNNAVNYKIYAFVYDQALKSPSESPRLPGNDPYVDTGWNLSIDTSKPVTTINSPAVGSWQWQNFDVSITDTDTGSGVNSSACYYRVLNKNSDGSWFHTVGDNSWFSERNCSSVVTLKIINSTSGECRRQGENTCKIEAYAVDNAGNQGSIASRKFSINYSVIKGRVTDANTTLGIGNARIDILRGSLTYSTTTDANGYYSINVLGDDTYDIIASASGYTLGTRNNVTMKYIETKTIDFALTPSPVVCEADCTFTFDDFCHSECNNQEGCVFNSSTAMNVCNEIAKPGWIRPYNDTYDIECCEGTPYPKAAVPEMKAAEVEINKTLNVVKTTRIVIYNGKPVTLNIITWK